MTTEDTYFKNDYFIVLRKAASNPAVAVGKVSPAFSGRRDTHA